MLWHYCFFSLVFCLSVVPIFSEECQRVLTSVSESASTAAPMTFNGIPPNTTNCQFEGLRFFLCGPGQGVLSDGDIGPTHSVDVSDADQVHRFFVWHRDNGTVILEFASRGYPADLSNVSYVEVYTLSLPSAKIGPPETSTFNTDLTQGTETTITPQSYTFSSADNTLTRSIFNLTETPEDLFVTFRFNESTDWLFISEIKLCSADPISSPTTDPTTPPTSPPPTPPPPTLTLSSLPPTGVVPDLSQPDSVSLTCSVASPATDDYQYQWQWRRRDGAPLSSSDSRFSITHSPNTQSSSTLLISGLRYSDAGDYMCEVSYGTCPDEVDCSGITPVTGTIRLNLPVFVGVESSGVMVREERSVIVLTCEVYGYPRNSSPPVWSSPGRDLQTERFNITLRNGDRPMNDSVPDTERVVSQLTITDVTKEDEGEYTCSVEGQSDTYRVFLGGSSSSSNSGMIAAIVITLLLVIIIVVTLIIIFLMVWRYRKSGKLDSCTCSTLSCTSCLALFAGIKDIKLPTRRHRSNSTKNGVAMTDINHTEDTNAAIYSVVQKPLKKKDSSPPPLPPLTLTETELNELMSVDEKEEFSPINEDKPSRRNTGLSIHSQSGSVPRLAKLTKLRKFKMKENPIYQSADELELDNALYALPSKVSSARNSASIGDGSTSDPIYSVAIDPTMFTKRASTIGTDDNLHPYGPIYARPVKQKTRQPLNVTERNIREVKQIGVGQFGAVVLAEMSGLSPSDVGSLPKDSVNTDGVALVAVKKLKPDVSAEVRQSFDKEIKFMSQLQHKSIVQLLAVCTQEAHPFIVMEYMENGDLNQFLQKYQMVSEDSAVYSNQIPPSALLYMVVQIASGMVYLASLNYVHRDLATRNCLVGSNFRIKISDFGMSRNLYERVYYRVRGRAMLPIRWMATESFYGRFSEKSDVWAYGVTVWEIFTLGKKQPYEELDDQDMIQDAIRGMGRRIMNKPEGCPQAVYEVLLRCWEYAAADRATFSEIHDSLNLVQLNS